jgi:predicted esterase YcpF (UPF0227 family)
MKKIVYLHGLGSHTNEKAQYLSETNEVYAPKIEYTNPQEFTNTFNEVKTFKPDLIIGSSMGGYYAFLMASLIKVDVLLFNPALRYRSIMIENIKKGYLSIHGNVVLGELDDTIVPADTRKYLKLHPNLNVSTISTMGHRIPLEQFKIEVSKIV